MGYNKIKNCKAILYKLYVIVIYLSSMKIDELRKGEI